MGINLVKSMAETTQLLLLNSNLLLFSRLQVFSPKLSHNNYSTLNEFFKGKFRELISSLLSLMDARISNSGGPIEY